MAKKSKSTKVVQASPEKSNGSAREAYEEGYLYCHRGGGKHRSPYARGSILDEYWIKGWECRYYGEPKEEVVEPIVSNS